jgi:hypothetical protein
LLKALTISEKKTFWEIIGSLMYLSVMTRPDITYAVSTLSQQLENPSITHLEFAQRVIQYLKDTKSLRWSLEEPHHLSADIPTPIGHQLLIITRFPVSHFY